MLAGDDQHNQIPGPARKHAQSAFKGRAERPGARSCRATKKTTTPTIMTYRRSS